MDNKIPMGVWIHFEDHGNGLMTMDLSQFSQEILENKEIWKKPPFIKTGRIINNNYNDIKLVEENLKNNK